MAKVRFLQSTYLVSKDNSFGFNDETEITNEKELNLLVEKGLVDVLKEEKPAKETKKVGKKATSRSKKEKETE